MLKDESKIKSIALTPSTFNTYFSSAMKQFYNVRFNKYEDMTGEISNIFSYINMSFSAVLNMRSYLITMNKE